jgi:recombination protein RecR
MDIYPTKLFEQAVNEFARLPGIGRKTAFRLVLHLLREPAEVSETFGTTLIQLRNEVKYCRQCFNICEGDICDICASNKRKSAIICVVEDIKDVVAIENTSQYNGVYHILGGIISPMDGVGPGDLNIEALFSRVSKGDIEEVILALPATIEGDTTNYYLFKRLKEYEISVTTIARGISFGDELEYADELTLGRSILNRIPYKH